MSKSADFIEPEIIQMNISTRQDGLFICPLCHKEYPVFSEYWTSIGSLPDCPVCRAVLPELVRVSNQRLQEKENENCITK